MMSLKTMTLTSVTFIQNAQTTLDKETEKWWKPNKMIPHPYSTTPIPYSSTASYL